MGTALLMIKQCFKVFIIICDNTYAISYFNYCIINYLHYSDIFKCLILLINA
jgi:hypothetical protein